MKASIKRPQLLYIDNVRVFCTVLVVVMHAAVTYSGMGSWYYKEPSVLDQGSALFFGVFQSHLQAFFMALFFLLSGYFVPASIERKGMRRFVADRLFRLGVPLLVYVFALHPLLIKILHPELDLGGFYWRGLRTLDVLSWTGPLWFVEALLLFTLASLPFAGRLGRPMPAAPIAASRIWLLIALISAGAFAIRLVYPIGTSVANLQLGYFAAYIAAFVVGLLAGARHWLDRIGYKSARRWLLTAFVFGLPLWLFSVISGGATSGRTDFNGGMHLAALIYACWESFFCVAIIISILGFAREKMNFQKPWMRFLADHCFGVYVFHAIILVLVSLALRPLVLPALPKFAVVSLLAVAASFAVASLIRCVPFLRRLFS